MLHNHLALHNGFNEGLEIFEEIRALSDIVEHLTEQEFHIVSSLVLTAAERLVGEKLPVHFPMHGKEVRPEPSGRNSFYIHDSPSYTFE
jgi:hypothetical protein